MRRLALLVLALAFALPAIAIAPLPFRDRAEEERFQTLVEELRCLVCQNQNLMDSDAGLAGDLRREVFDLMRSGKSDAEIRDFLVQRYGDFVLYRPPVKRTTWLLWFGPAALLVGAGFVVMRLARRRSSALPADATGIEDLP